MTTDGCHKIAVTSLRLVVDEDDNGKFRPERVKVVLFDKVAPCVLGFNVGLRTSCCFIIVLLAIWKLHCNKKSTRTKKRLSQLII